MTYEQIDTFLTQLNNFSIALYDKDYEDLSEKCDELYDNIVITLKDILNQTNE